MKLDCESLKAAFDVVENVPLQSGVLSSQYVRVVSNEDSWSLALTGIVAASATLKVPGSQPFTLYADRRGMSAFLSVAKKEITVEVSKSSAILKSGRNRVELALVESVSGYGKRGSLGSTEIKLDDGNRSVIRMLSRYTPSTPGHSKMEAVYSLGKYGYLATDSFVLAACLTKDAVGTCPLPSELAKLATESSESFRISEKEVVLVLKPGYVYQAKNSDLEKYPLAVTQSLIDKAIKTNFSIVFEAAPLIDALNYLRKFSYNSPGDAVISCESVSGEKFVTLKLESVAVKADRKVESSVKASGKLVFPLERLYSWADFVKGDLSTKDKEPDFVSGKFENCNFMRAVSKQRSHVFIAVDGL